MPGAVFIEGDEVNLRTVEEEDLEFIRDTYNHPEVRQNMSNDLPANKEQERDFFENRVCDEDNIYLAVSVDEEMIGLVSLEEKRSESTAEIGIWVHPDHHGQGYGSEASRLLVDHGFRELRYHRIIALAYESNEASRKIWDKLGFEEEGAFREHVYHKGEYEDVYIYGLLEQEWES